MKTESNWSGDPRMRPAWGECDERLSLAKPGAEAGGKQESSWGFKQAADGKLVMTGGLGNRRQPAAKQTGIDSEASGRRK